MENKPTKDTRNLDEIMEEMCPIARFFSMVPVIIGIWAIACFISGLIHYGPIGMIKGFATAIFG